MLREPTVNRRIISRVILLVVGCLPVLCLHVLLSIVLFVGILYTGIYLGLWIVSGALIWWLLGTTGLAFLIYSSATFNQCRRGLPVWQLAGLISGLVAGIPLAFWFGHTGSWLTCLVASLACCAASYIIFFALRGNLEKPNKPAHPTAGNVLN